MRHYNGWEQIVNKNSEKLMKYNWFEKKTLNGIQEVSGSIPLISTKRKALKPLYVNGFKAFFVSFCKTVIFSYMMSKQRI